MLFGKLLNILNALASKCYIYFCFDGARSNRNVSQFHSDPLSARIRLLLTRLENVILEKRGIFILYQMKGGIPRNSSGEED